MPPYAKNMTEQFLAPKKTSVGWPWRLFLFAAVLLGLTLLIYFGVTLGYQPYLRQEHGKLDQEINKIGGVISETDRENFINFYSQSANLQSLLNKHVRGSVIFSLLEENTNKNVYYEAGTLSVAERVLRLEGVAKSYDNLIQQLVAFERLPETEQVLLEESQNSDRGVRFTFKVIFKPSLFNFNRQIQ